MRTTRGRTGWRGCVLAMGRPERFSRGVMKPHWSFWVVAVWAGLSTVPTVAREEPPLRVMAEVDGRWLPLWGMERGWAMAADGERRVRLLPDTPLRIEGDLGEAVGWWQWPVWFRVQADSDAIERWTLSVQSERLPSEPGPEERRFRRRWETWDKAVGVQVMAWVVDGRVTQARLNVPRRLGLERPVGELSLTRDERGGRAIVLQVREGSAVRALGAWGLPRFDRLLDRLALGDDEGVAAEVLATDGAAVCLEGNSLLHYAAQAGAAATARRLIELGARVDRTDATGKTALHHAAANGRVEAVRTLLRLKAGASQLDRDGNTPLHLAAAAGHEEVVAQLVEARGVLNQFNHAGYSPVLLALDQNHAPIVEALVARRVRVDFREEQMSRVLITKASEGQTRIVRLMLERGTAPQIEHRGGTPLIAAADAGKTEIVRLLLQAKAPVDYANFEGHTALMAAARKGHTEAAAALIAAGADVNRANRRGVRPLHFAAANGSAATVRWLLENGADPEATNESRLTPLLLAAIVGSREVAVELLAAGARLDPSHPLFELAIEGVLTMDLPAALERAFEGGWTPRARLDGRWPLLRVAQLMGASACRDWLLAAGAPIEDATDGPEFASAAQLDERLRPTRIVAAEDPRSTRSRHGEARVELSLVIDDQGRVRFARVVAAEDEALAGPALAAVQQWRFEPPRRGGEPVAVWARLPVAFPDYRSRVLEMELLDTAPKPIRQVAPRYPDELARSGVQGRVELSFVVDREGKVRDVSVALSSNPAFEAPAMEAIAQWEFEPGAIDGRPVETRMRLPMRFSLTAR